MQKKYDLYLEDILESIEKIEKYTKEEYLEMLPKVIQHVKDMPYIDKKGRTYNFGEFFPPEISPSLSAYPLPG